jgi:hypothetical protein
VFIDETFSGRKLGFASMYGELEEEVLFTPGRQWQVLKVAEGPDLTWFGEAVKRIVYRREVPVTTATPI